MKYTQLPLLQTGCMHARSCHSTEGMTQASDCGGTGVDAGTVHVEFVVKEGALGQVSLRVHRRL